MAFPVPKIQERFWYVGANATSTTWSHRVLDGGNRLLLVMVTARNNGAVTAPTYGGTSMTLVPGSEVSAGTSTSRRYVSWYYMLAPAVGTANLVLAVASADSGNYAVLVLNMVDVGQTTPFQAQGGNYALTDSGTAATSTTLTPASAVGDLVLSAIYSGAAFTASSNQFREASGGVSARARCDSKPGEASTTSIGGTQASNTLVHSSIAVIGDATTQPSLPSYSGSRGKKSFCVGSRLSGEVLSAGATTYVSLSPSVESSASSSTNRTMVRTAGTISAPATLVTVNAATTDSTFVLQINGTDSAVSITVSAAATGYIEGSGSAAVSAGDQIGWKLVCGATGGVTFTHLVSVYECTAAETVTFLGSHSSSSAKLVPGETRRLNVIGARGSTNTVARAAWNPIPLNADWEGVAVTKVGTTTNGAVTMSVSVNDSTGNQTLSWAAGSNTSQEDTTNTDALTEGALIHATLVSAGSTGDFEYERIASRLVSTDKEFLVMAGAGAGNGVPIGVAGTTQYAVIGGELGYTTTESLAQIKAPFDMAISRLAVQAGENISLSTGSGGADFKLRVNGADTSLATAVIRGGDWYVSYDRENVVNVNAGDLISISVSHRTGGGSNELRMRNVGFVAVERAAAAVPSITALSAENITATSADYRATLDFA